MNQHSTTPLEFDPESSTSGDHTKAALFRDLSQQIISSTNEVDNDLDFHTTETDSTSFASGTLSDRRQAVTHRTAQRIASSKSHTAEQLLPPPPRQSSYSLKHFGFTNGSRNEVPRFTMIAIAMGIAVLLICGLCELGNLVNTKQSQTALDSALETNSQLQSPEQASRASLDSTKSNLSIPAATPPSLFKQNFSSAPPAILTNTNHGANSHTTSTLPLTPPRVDATTLATASIPSHQDSIPTSVHLPLAKQAQKFMTLLDYSDAQKALEQALTVEPHNWNLWSELSYCQLVQMHYIESEFAAQRAVELHPTASTAWFNLAESLYATGRYAEAKTAFQRCLNLKPSAAEAKVAKYKLANIAQLP